MCGAQPGNAEQAFDVQMRHATSDANTAIGPTSSAQLNAWRASAVVVLCSSLRPDSEFLVDQLNN